MYIILNYMPPNWNDYINKERTSYFIANKIKQKEKQIVKYHTIGKKYTGGYPIKITLKPHFKDYRQDLDNFRYKGIIDGLVSAKVIENDNLKHIQRIELIPVFDNKKIVEIFIEKENKNEI